MIRLGVTFAALTALAFAGCSGKPVAKIEDVKELPKELTKDIQDKFEVRDTSILTQGTARPPGGDADAALPGGKKKKRRKKKDALAGDTAVAPSGAPAPSGVALAYPVRRPVRESIWIGERATYDITYFGMSAGDFVVEAVAFKAVDNRKVFHIKGSAISSKVFSLFYRLNDSVESFFDFEGRFSHRFHLLLDETKQTRDALELYDNEKAQTFYWNRWNHKERGYSETKEFQPMPQFAQDSVSALYYLRSVPLADHTVVSFPVVSEGKNWEAVVTVLGREEVDSPMGRVRAIKLQPETKYQGVLKKNGDSFMWLTDDDRRWLIRLEAKVKIGTVIARLKAIEPGTEPGSEPQP